MNLLKMDEAIKYIESMLTEDIDLNKAGEVAGCSGFHFGKIFMYLTDMSINTYIRNRRMTLAAYDLQNSDAKVIDISAKYGYESSTAFNRAFKKVHKVAPSKVKNKNISLNYHEPITLNIEVKGNRQFTYSIVRKDAFRVVGTRERYKINLEENFKSVPAQWFKAMMTGKIKRLLKMCDSDKQVLLGVSAFEDEEIFDYYIGVETKDECPKKFSEYVVPEGEYAVFECVGAIPKALQELQRNIVKDWLPASGYEYGSSPDIEVYYEGDRNSDDYKCEVWLPVVK